MSSQAADPSQPLNGWIQSEANLRYFAEYVRFWDNAVIERFSLNLKMKRVWQKDYANHAEAGNDIADYIVGFYNSIRLHSKLGNLSPNAFEPE